MRVLVNGGSGYIGTTLIRRLVRRGHAVYCLDPRSNDLVHLLGDLRGPSSARYVGIRGDVRDQALLRSLVQEVDCAVHLAAIVGTPACDADREAASSINVGGAANIMAAVPEGFPVVLSSTCSLYGHVTSSICRESDPVAPLTHYGRTKADAENIVLTAGGTVLRFATAYGLSPRFRWDLLLHTFFKIALSGIRLKLYDPQAWRPMVHVEDAAAAICFALENFSAMAGNAYNVGSAASTLTKLNMAERVARVTDFEFEIDGSMSDPDQRNYRVSFDRIEALGYAAEIDIDEAIPVTFEGVHRLFMENRAR